MGGPVKTAVIALCIVFLVTFHLEVTEVSYEALYDTDKVTFFSYVTDPMNFKTLNPTIIDLKVHKKETHSMTVYYTEHLVQLPFIRNYATAVYNIYTENPTWKMESFHRTCFITDFMCLPTNSTVKVRTIRPGLLHYQEDISYSCPWFLTPFCQREVRMQRQLIMSNLARIF